jgi:hypothetical protein
MDTDLSTRLCRLILELGSISVNALYIFLRFLYVYDTCWATMVNPRRCITFPVPCSLSLANFAHCQLVHMLSICERLSVRPTELDSMLNLPNTQLSCHLRTLCTVPYDAPFSPKLSELGGNVVKVPAQPE